MAKDRFQLTLDREVSQVIRELSTETGQPMASLIAELITAAHPGLSHTLKLLRLAKQTKLEAKDRVVAHLEQTLEKIEQEVEAEKRIAEKFIH